MEKNPLKSFIALVDFDRQVHDIKKTISDLEQRISSLQTKIRKFHQELEQKKQEFFLVKKQLSDAELELKSIDMILAEKKEQLHGGDYKTLQAKKNEIERMQNLQAEQERLVIDLVNRVDHLSKGFEKNSLDVTQEVQKIESEIKTDEESLSRAKSNLELKDKQRSSYQVDIPEDWLAMYKEMQEKVPDPVVPLSFDTCSGCFSMLTASDLQAVKRNVLVRCKLCFRLIYNA